MSKQSPPSIGDDYGAWKKEIKVWELGTDVAVKKQAPVVIGVLGGDYKTVAMEMSLDDMKKDDGLDLLIAHLDKVFEKDKNDNAYEKYIIFEDIRRNPGEDIGEFMIRFDRAMKQAKAIEIVYPDNVLAFKLMRSMNLSADEQKMIMTACTEIKYATMQSAIKRILSGKSSSACGSNEIRIKQEAQDSFYARGAYNQSNRGGSKSGYSKYQQYGSNVNQQQYQPQTQGKNKPVNPKDRFGNTMLCLMCDSKYHLIRQCPQKVASSYFTRAIEGELEAEPNLENVTHNVKFQYFTKEFASPQAIYLAESFGNAILDTGCTKTVCGELWLKDFAKKSNVELKTSPSSSVYRFGDGELVRATKQVVLPMDLAGDLFNLECDVVSDDVPLLISLPTMETTETVIDMPNSRVRMFGKDIPTTFTSTGLIMIDMLPHRAIADTFEDYFEEAVTVNVCQFVEKKLDKASVKKLHCQLGHGSYDKLKRLLSDAGLGDKELFSLLQEVIESCEICKVYKKPPAKPATSFPRARAVNECVAIDLHQLDSNLYYLHIIDEFSRFSQAGIVRSKKPSEIIDVFSEKWLSIVGCPGLVFCDNGEEFCSKEFEDWAENFNIEQKTSAAHSPFSNGIVERHNAVISLMMKKLAEEFPGTKVETLLAWACSAKNSLSTIAGFSPNQLMFGTQTYLPNVLNSNPPALENETTSKTVASHINAMHAARKMYLSCESDSRIMKALKKPLRTYAAPVTLGRKVYFKAVGSDKWKGPATVIGQDSAVVFLRQGTFVTRIHQSRIMPVKEHVSLEVEEEPVVMGATVQNTEPDKETGLLGIPHYFAADQDPVQEEEDSAALVPIESVPEPSADLITENEAETSENLPALAENDVQDLQPSIVGAGIETNKRQKAKTPAIKTGSSLIFVVDGQQYEAVVLSRAGKATGRKKHCYNVYVKDTGEEIHIDVSTLDDYTVVNKDDADGFDLETVEDVYAVQVDEYATEKQAELSSWISNKVYEEVSIQELDARKVITSTWVCKQSGETKKARLVARGFLEDTTSIIRDSPTCCKESLRLLLAIIAGKNWTVQAFDIKFAFLQGDDMERLVYMKPPKEANAETGVIRKLKKCVYGLVDASLQWYQRVADCLIDLDGTKSKDPAVFYWRKDGELEGILALHVDDFMYAGSEKFLEDVMKRVKEEFVIKVEEKSAFTYLGLEIQQKATYIELNQKKYIQELKPIDIPSGDLKTRDLSSDEKNLLKSKLGQLL